MTLGQKQRHFTRLVGLINALFWRDRVGELRHCQLAYLGELAREHLPEDL
ncbi:MAG: hypothetical protein H5U32_02735 [Pseudomonas balearica]|nr:hypothetical protein [Stutzerimonas balearica]MBC7198144.1 hypothetical protein [Stutzerimonas balearica]